MENSLESYKIVFRIISYLFLPDAKNPILIIEEIGCSTFIRLSVKELSKNDQMIKGFSPEDAYKIGYIAGMM